MTKALNILTKTETNKI